MPFPDLAVMAFMGATLVAGSLLVIAAFRTARAIIVAPMLYSRIIWAAIIG